MIYCCLSLSVYMSMFALNVKHHKAEEDWTLEMDWSRAGFTWSAQAILIRKVYWWKLISMSTFCTRSPRVACICLCWCYFVFSFQPGLILHNIRSIRDWLISFLQPMQNSGYCWKGSFANSFHLLIAICKNWLWTVWLFTLRFNWAGRGTQCSGVMWTS